MKISETSPFGRKIWSKPAFCNTLKANMFRFKDKNGFMKRPFWYREKYLLAMSKRPFDDAFSTFWR